VNEDGKSPDDDYYHFEDNLKSVLKYWIKNEVKSEDDFNCRSVVVRIWEEIDEKEGWMEFVDKKDYNWTDKQYEKNMDYNEQELGNMYGDLKSMLSYYDLNGDFDQEYYNSKMEEREKRRIEYQREEKELKKEKKSNKEKFKLWDKYKEEKSKKYNVPTIVSKGSRDLLDILKKILPKVSIEEEHLLIDNRYYRLDFYFELDERKIGIEYQGKQHLEKVDYFGGVEQFKKQKMWDKEKQEICQYLGIELVYFYYNEKMTESLVKEKLNYNKI